MNLIFVCHCHFRGNSAMHLCSIASVLADLGHSCAICVPERAETILDRGRLQCQVLDYDEALRYGVSFANNRGPDLVHAWTPRELVRKTTISLAQRYNIPYFVHFEDNENVLLLDDLPDWSLEDLERLPTHAIDLLVPPHRTHPQRSRQLLVGAAGVTALIDRLLEFKPAHTPSMVFFPGYDPEFAKIDDRNEELRATLGIRPEELLVVYTGNIHGSNFQEVRSLLLAVALANRHGVRVKLVKTGFSGFPPSELSDHEIAQHVLDRGFVTRSELPQLLAAADILVQPGQSGAFNDYRFPSKLPEFLASGRPVILPRSNLGLLLKDGEEAIVLQHGHSAEIADALERLASDAGLRARIGKNGRSFALRNLDWTKNVATLPRFYEECLAKCPSSSPPSATDEPAAPKLISFYLPQFHRILNNGAENENAINSLDTSMARANSAMLIQAWLRAYLNFYDDTLKAMEARVSLARGYGISGFCFYYYWFDGRRLLEQPLNQFLEREQPDFPFCVCWANENWARRWHGHEEVLIKQEYREDFSVKFIRDVIPILKDRRYLRVHGDPILLVYRVSLLPDPYTTVGIWRAECRKAGISSIHLVAMQSDGVGDPRRFGFDAAVECPADNGTVFGNGQGLSDAQATFGDHVGDDRKGVIDQSSNRPPVYTLYRMAFLENPLRCKEQGHIHRSSVRYQARLRRATAETMILAELQAPLLFVNSWNNRREGAMPEPAADGDECFLEATRHGLSEGFADYLRALAIRVEVTAIPKLLMSNQHNVVRSNRVQNEDRQRYKTEDWFADEQLRGIADRYRGKFVTAPLSFATVRDYCDSFDHLRPIATANGDLKDNQRPWVLKAILSVVRPGGRILEIGAGEPFVADIFDRLGYEVWVVDPYDGTGNGPVEYERFRNECPSVHFVRGFFGEQLLSAPPGGFDCIYSISVLEHVPAEALNGIFAGIKKYLRPNGWSIHAVDHVHKGRRAVEHYKNLIAMARWSGIEESELVQLLEQMDADPETYYVSAESHNRWRGSLPYDEFPMRVCVSIQLVSRAWQLRVTSAETK
jgi:glycosyltransferase involved in cell wall biosynthesis/2-polyprenyl-3-methyl-5-hydroxy-6-metoxy-1,4-benzoquinol methylase